MRTHKNLLNTLRRFDDLGGDRIQVVIHETLPYTKNAVEASENYNIVPRALVEIEASQRSTKDIFLGLVFTSGPDEFVIPFFDRGLPVEYELARSIRVVTQLERKKLGIIATDAKDQAKLECPDLAMPIGSGLLDWDPVLELGQVVTGRAPGRTSADDITLFESQGIALEDVAVAAHIFERAKAEGTGEALPF